MVSNFRGILNLPSVFNGRHTCFKISLVLVRIFREIIPKSVGEVSKITELTMAYNFGDGRLKGKILGVSFTKKIRLQTITGDVR